MQKFHIYNITALVDSGNFFLLANNLCYNYNNVTGEKWIIQSMVLMHI